MKMKHPIYIGSSGWHYEYWKGTFYEENLSDEKLLEYFCNEFKTVKLRMEKNK